MKNIFILSILLFPFPCVLSQVKIMPVGESTTSQFPGYRKTFYDLAVADGLTIDMIGPNSDGTALSYDGDNAGYTGFTCSRLIDTLTLSPDLDKYHPDIVILLEGTNDCGWAYLDYVHLPIAELSLLIDKLCLKYPDALIFIGSISPMSESAYAGLIGSGPGVASANVTAYNDAMPDSINLKFAAGKAVYFVAAGSLLSVSTDISDDGIHPNQSGYDKLGVSFYNAIKPYINSLVTGITETEENEVSVYPNPVTNYQLTIDSNYKIKDKISLSLYDMKGSEVYYADIRYTPSISVSLPHNLMKGLYFLKIKSGFKTEIIRIVIG